MARRASAPPLLCRNAVLEKLIHRAEPDGFIVPSLMAAASG